MRQDIMVTKEAAHLKVAKRQRAAEKKEPGTGYALQRNVPSDLLSTIKVLLSLQS
jgi:hypothetical protein